MIRRFRYLTRLRGDRDRQLILSGSILAVIFLVLFINLIIMLITRSSNQNTKSINNQTTNSVPNTTSIQLPEMSTSEKSTTSAVQITSSMTVVGQLEHLLTHSLPKPIHYESYGRPLSNTLPWMGNASLYLFIISAGVTSYNILHRYALDPPRNITELQTIHIPSDAVFVDQGYLVGIGMQEDSDSSDANQIYAVKTAFSAIGLNITSNSTTFIAIIDNSNSVAFGYNVLYKIPTA